MPQRQCAGCKIFLPELILVTSPAELPNVFPGTWRSCTVAEAGAVIVGQQKASDNSPGQSYPYLRAANVQDGVLDLRELFEMPFADPDRYRLRSGDILICEGSGSRNLVGRPAIYHGDLPDLMFQNLLLRFRAFTGINSTYALLVFRAYQKTGVFSEIAKGIGISHIGLSRFAQLPFPIPPASVQQELALAAGAIQDNLDLLQDAVESALGELSGMMPKARDSLTLGRNAASWRDGSAGDSPWPLVPAAGVVDPDAPIVYGIVQPGPEVDGGVPYVRGQDLQDGVILLDQLRHTSVNIAERYQRSSLRPDDVLMGIIRHTRVARVPAQLAGGNITQGSARLRPGEQCRSDFLAHWLASAAAQQWLRAKMRGIDMPGLNLRDVRQLPVPVPPTDVQAEIAQQLDEASSRAEGLRRSFDLLSEALPGLERDLLQSFAYGTYAAAMSRATAGDMERELSEEVARLLQLRETPHEAQRPFYDSVSGHEDWQEAPELAAGTSPEVTTVGPKIAGKVAVTSPREIRDALTRFSRPVTPEELFSSLELAWSAIDSFYAGIRELVEELQVNVVRPDNIRATIELRH